MRGLQGAGPWGPSGDPARGRRERTAGAWRARRLPLLSLVARGGEGRPEAREAGSRPPARSRGLRASTGARTHLLVVLAQPDPHRIQLGHRLRALPKLASGAPVLPPINGQARGRRRTSSTRGARRRPRPAAARYRGHRRRPSCPPPGPSRPSRCSPFATARARSRHHRLPAPPSQPPSGAEVRPRPSSDRRPNRRGHAHAHAQCSRLGALRRALPPPAPSACRGENRSARPSASASARPALSGFFCRIALLSTTAWRFCVIACRCRREKGWREKSRGKAGSGCRVLTEEPTLRMGICACPGLR